LASRDVSGVAARAAADALSEAPMAVGVPTDDRKNSKLTEIAVKEVLRDTFVILSSFRHLATI